MANIPTEKLAQFILIALGVILIVVNWFVYPPMGDNPLEVRSPYYERIIGAVLILIALLLPYIWRRHKRSNS